MNATEIQYSLGSVVLKRLFCAKDLPRSVGPTSGRCGSFTRNFTDTGRRASELHFQSETSREILRLNRGAHQADVALWGGREGLQDDGFYLDRKETLCGLHTVVKLAFASLACALLVGCSGGNSQSAPQVSSQPTIVVTAVKSQLLRTTTPLPAQIKPYESVEIFPKVAGFITAIPVDRGSRVKAGELLVKLSAPELVAQRTQAEAAVNAAQSQVVAAKAKLASDQTTYLHLKNAAQTPGVVAENDLAVAEQAAASDQAQVQAAQENAVAARQRLRSVSELESYLEIRAPFDGIVTERNLHPGALVGPSTGAGAQPILQVESIGKARLVIDVPEDYAIGIHEGQQVNFAVDSIPGKIFHAPVARISHAIDEKTRTMAVELGIRNEPQLVPGMFVTVQWQARRTAPTLFVPTTAIANDLQRTFVVRVKDSKVEWIDVKPGATAGNAIEAFGDLQPNDLVAVRGTDELKPGTQVSVKQQ